MLFSEVLKDNKAFTRCFRRGKFCACSFGVAYFTPNKLPYNRVGISVGKKLGGAVERNRVKRIFRASYRQNEALFPIGYDIVFTGKNDAAEKSSKDVDVFIKTRLIKAMNKQDNPNKPNKFSKPNKPNKSFGHGKNNKNKNVKK